MGCTPILNIDFGFIAQKASSEGTERPPVGCQCGGDLFTSLVHVVVGFLSEYS